MKMQSTVLLAPLNKEKLLSLATEVKEVLATQYKKIDQPVFSAADLWNIQRQRKGRTKRRALAI